MAKRNVKTFSICVQPETLVELEHINAVAGGPDLSRSQLISYCIHITFNLLNLKMKYDQIAKGGEHNAVKE